jgi:hypothetical protein
MKSLDRVDLLQFLEVSESLRARVLSSFPGIDSVADFLVQINRHRIPRDGVVSDVHYEAHGVGCRFWKEHGPEVDLDLSEEGLEIFDAWRLRIFLRSIRPQGSPSVADVERFLSGCVESGGLRVVKPGWYAAGPASSHRQMLQRRDLEFYIE